MKNERKQNKYQVPDPAEVLFGYMADGFHDQPVRYRNNETVMRVMTNSRGSVEKHPTTDTSNSEK